MLYEVDLDVPANTPEKTPVKGTIKLTKGIVNKVGVQFPIGTRATVHVRIYRGGHQVWPTNPDGDIKADGFVVEWDEFYNIDDEPVDLTVMAWSTADTYQYTITTRVNLISPEIVGDYSSTMGYLKKFLRAMGVIK